MINVGIVGATGLVGLEMLSILQDSILSISELKLFASSKSAGQIINFRGTPHTVEITKKDCWEKGTYLLGATSSETALKWIPDAVASGAIVIDNSSAFRMVANIPLIVPEVNGHELQKKHTLIANPNCSTIQLVMALSPLASIATIEWISVSTYQSVSGGGKEGIERLKHEEISNLQVNANTIHRNVICEIGEPEESNYTGEEEKLIYETPKIMGTSFPIFPACARVPVLIGHTESVTIKFESDFPASKAKEILAEAPGVEVSEFGYRPRDISGSNLTIVGRIRNHPFDKSIIQLWVTADNVRKGAALNAVQILETMVNKKTGS